MDAVLPGPERPGQPHQESWCGVVGVEILQGEEIYNGLDLT